jgi:transposase
MSARRVYTEEFKREAVRLANQSGNLSATARNLGVCQTVLQRWKKALGEDNPIPFPGHGNPSDPELAILKRENARLQEEVDILKKAVGIFTSRPR